MAEVNARGVRFHVQRLGEQRSGPPIVFVHGLVMDNLSSFYFTLATPLAASAHVILYDLRGHGMSERTKTGYSLDDMVGDLDALLEALDVRAPALFVGNSFGGLTALAFASKFPARSRGVALIDAHLGASGWAEKMVETLGLEGEARDQKIAASFQSWLGRHSERKSTRLAKAASELVYETSLTRDLRGSRSLDDDDLRKIACPILALYGSDSDLRKDAERLSRVAPRCELKIYDGCTHSVLWEATARVKEDVTSWIRARSGGT